MKIYFEVLNSENTTLSYFRLIVGNSMKFSVYSPIALMLNKWQNIAYVLDYPQFNIYIDGVSVVNASVNFYPSNVIRTSGYIGKSNWVGWDKMADVDLDEIKIFNRGLNKTEIQNEINNNILVNN